MKVLMVNGSPHEKGCTYTAMQEIERVLNSEGIDTEIFWLGNEAIASCKACYACGKTGSCVMDDAVNAFLEKAKEADGFVFGSPVHFASLSGAMTSFMDRVFIVATRQGKNVLAHKPAMTLVSARRAGTTATLDQLNKYPVYNQMPLVPSRYWNMVHGSKPEDVLKDAEGLQIMRYGARNLAWMLKLIENGKAAGIEAPEEETRVATNFIR